MSRNLYQPAVPEILKDLRRVALRALPASQNVKDSIAALFPNTCGCPCFKASIQQATNRPLKIGAVFSGGPAAGGHNILAGIWDALKQIGLKSKLIGFLGGPAGIISGQSRELSQEDIDGVRNLGGFDLIGSGRTKIETLEQMTASLKVCQDHKLDGLVIIGGDDSNTNAAVLAEFFLAKNCKTVVIGVPKTIDGDLRSKDIEISFGFDSACRTYSEMIGNIARDAKSSRRYYHFIKLMGRSASNITLECALATQPNLALIGEEGESLDVIVSRIADLIVNRAKMGKEYGVILVPEGLVEFVPEIKTLIQELNAIMSREGQGNIADKLSLVQKQFFSKLPEKIQNQLLLERDSHGNVAVSQIETEQLLIDLVKKELKKRSDYQGKFIAQEHFLGYEGRACIPTNFDANYCYALGLLSAIAVRDGATGAICAIQGLRGSPSEWTLKMVPIVSMMRLEVRKGKEKPVIQKALVDINQDPFVYFSRFRKSWELEDLYRYPGPIQFLGSKEITDQVPRILLRANYGESC